MNCKTARVRFDVNARIKSFCLIICYVIGSATAQNGLAGSALNLKFGGLSYEYQNYSFLGSFCKIKLFSTPTQQQSLMSIFFC